MGRPYLSGVETHRVETRSGGLVDTAAEELAVVKHDRARFRLFLVRRWIVADVIDPGAFTCGPGQHFLAEFLAGTVGERGDIQADARQIRRLHHDLRLSAGTENESRWFHPCSWYRRTRCPWFCKGRSPWQPWP